jgi:hypothetical protein
VRNKRWNHNTSVTWSFGQQTIGASAKGVLTVTDGTDVATITLLGQYLNSVGTVNSTGSNLFQTAVDSSTGTLVTTTHT